MQIFYWHQGVITGATIKLHAQPEAIAAAVVSFPDTTSAVKTVVETLQCAIPMARMELLDQVSVKVIKVGGLERPPRGPDPPFLDQ